MKKQRSEKRTTVPNSRLFPRHRARIPARVQAASELWLDLFTGFCDGLLMSWRSGVEDSPCDITAVSEGVSPTLLTNKARELADSALHQFEDRWPDVKLEGTRD